MKASRTFPAGMLLAVWLFCAAGGAVAQTASPPKPGARDLCPVCGMLVAKYPNWIASLRFRDGHTHFFDGPKDLFKYLHDLGRYAPGHTRADIAAIFVTDFYELKPIAAESAWYVIGSDVPGPMGHELVPLASRADAEEFLRDHKGRRILGFADITPAVLAALDGGR